MKAQVTFTRKLWYMTLVMIGLLAFNPMYGQNDTSTAEVAQKGRTIKGIISDENGPLESVNVTLKDAQVGTVTNEKGEFTFPKLLKTGDVLQFSFLGFQTVEFKIKANTTFIRKVMVEEVIEFMGDLNTNQRYSSRRKN